MRLSSFPRRMPLYRPSAMARHRTAHPRIQGSAVSAATGPGGVCGFAPGPPPLPARGPLPPAYGGSRGGDQPRRFGHGNSLFGATGAGVKSGSGNGWWRPVPPNGDHRGACTWTPPTYAPILSPLVPGVPRAARTRRPKAAAGVASAPCATMYRPRIRWGLRIRAVIHPGSASSLSSTSLNLCSRSGMW